MHPTTPRPPLTAQQALELSRYLDHHLLALDHPPSDPARSRPLLSDETLEEIRAAFTAARDACDLIVGACVRVGALPQDHPLR